MATAGAVHVKGLRELTRDFKKMSKELDDEVTDELKRVAEPVKQVATRYALGHIGNMPRSPRWAGMRVGVAKGRGVVWMRPAARRRGGSPRSNLGPLLQREMEAAVENKEQEVVNGLDKMLGRLGGDYGF